jgi:hypothetical protein
MVSIPALVGQYGPGAQSQVVGTLVATQPGRVGQSGVDGEVVGVRCANVLG